MITPLLLCLCLPGDGARPTIEARQFRSLIGGLHAGLEDVSLVYEGYYRNPRPRLSMDEALKDIAGIGDGYDYQGSYAIRADGATNWERYVTRINKGFRHESRSASSLINAELSVLHYIGNGIDDRKEVRGGGPGVLNETFSPERILYLWFLQPKHLAQWEGGYQFLGWESVDGHECAVVLYGALESAATGTPSFGTKLWVDMERGGNPLKVELWDHMGRRLLCTGIELGQVADPSGRQFWLPMRGHAIGFPIHKGKYLDHPGGIETYHVIDNSYRLNQGLSDGDFTIERAARRGDSKVMQVAEQTYRKSLPRNDPKGIQERLARQLAEADAEAGEVRAPHSSGSPWETVALQVPLFLLGVSIVLIASKRMKAG